MTPHLGKKGRRYYLSDVPLERAVRDFESALREAGGLAPTRSERLPLEQALGRITSEPVWARISSPHYDSAAMDGVAVRAADTVGATETSPIRLKVGPEASWVDTGDPIPDGFDAVIMVEVIHEVDDDTIEIRDPVPPYHHVRPLGEDIVATELLLPSGHRIGPADLGACASAGLLEIDVRLRPQVAVLPTGNELVSAGSELNPGEIIESNGLMLAAMVREWGGEAALLSPVPDDPAALESAIRRAARKADVIVINAGSSAGDEDYTAEVVSKLGRLVVHGVAVRPGHPVVLGVVDGKPVLGIPGYPVSAAVTSELFVKPLIEQMLGTAPSRRDSVSATMTRKVLSPMGEDEFLRVGLGRVGGRLVATPLQRGAGVIMSLVRADGLALIPRFSEGVDEGAEVEVELLRPLKQIEGTIVAIGSHDLTLDLLADRLRRSYPAYSLSSSNVGSLGGLMALRRGESHLAGSHLLDEESGEYNLPFVRRYLRGRDIVVVNLVRRVQGLIVAPGNPLAVTHLGDLRRPDIAFVNRQRGSGTRVLLDYKLAELGIDPSEIRGYDREEYTHLAVAASVAAGGADTGLGILSAARALDVDFVPLMSEQYDLVAPREFYDSDLLRPLFELIRSDAFRVAVDALGGYDTSRTGSVVAELDST